MTTIRTLAAEHGWAAVEFSAWGWAATLDAELRRTAEIALASQGPAGIEALVATGPALGGLDAAQLTALVATVDSDLSGAVLAA